MSRRNSRRLPVRGLKCQLKYKGICTVWATTRDHKIPLSRGGEDVFSNLQPACSACNRHKWKDMPGG